MLRVLRLALFFTLPLLSAQSARASFVGATNPSCAPGEYTRWWGGPTTWYLNEQGYPPIPFDTLEALIKDAFAEWSTPCCSGFQSIYMGTTSTRINVPIRQNTVFFEHVAWPREFGNRGLVGGTTLRFTDNECSAISATILLNAMDFTFLLPHQQPGGYKLDLMNVIVHEFGHWLGLNHNTIPDSVMKGNSTSLDRYTRLGQVDIDGVCTLYPGSCETCDTSKPCASGSICRDGKCIAAECRRTPDCPPGSICVTGECFVPECARASDCAAGESCLSGRCVDPCGGVSCTPGSVCKGGKCVDPCAGLSCPVGHFCRAGTCVEGCEEPCPTGTICSRGECVERCGEASCGDDEQCVSGACVKTCSGECPDGMVCNDGRCTSICEDGDCTPNCGKSVCGDGERCGEDGCEPACPPCGEGEGCDTVSGECVELCSCDDASCKVGTNGPCPRPPATKKDKATDGGGCAHASSPASWSAAGLAALLWAALRSRRGSAARAACHSADGQPGYCRK